ncbi:MAG TPA: SpoIIE family protein phosphatase [Bryobacterales bacterium]|nr:SpoIIE family protein phosphatase [Bryobacterales bacterium]
MGSTPSVSPASLLSEAGKARPFLAVVEPNGKRQLVKISKSPFQIGRLAECEVSLRDSRISRQHAQIVSEDESYFLEDLNSRHGTFVNGKKVARQKLSPNDRIDFGIEDSYHLIFTFETGDTDRLLAQLDAVPATHATGNLAKLRAVLEVARALESSMSLEDVLGAVVDAALVVTGAERGFLLLHSGEGTPLEMRVARDKNGRPLDESDLRVPRGVIQRALHSRRDLLSMNFDPSEMNTEKSIVDLELRSVVCVPLVRIRIGHQHETSQLSTKNDTLGVLYMDSRLGSADLSAGNRELLQSLAIETSTVLENARLMSQERDKRRMEQELAIAREIQRSLLPSRLPEQGWFRAAGSSQACFQVGGDYYDVMELSDTLWGAVLADVSGKGVSAALLTSLLQGAFFATAGHQSQLSEIMSRVNRYVCERSQTRNYATVFYCTVDHDGATRWINAGHCPPLVVHANGKIETLPASGCPVGLFPAAPFGQEETRLSPGDKLVIYSDGVTEAENSSGHQFGEDALLALVKKHTVDEAAQLHQAIIDEVAIFTAGAPQNDDVTLVVLEYRG